MPTPVPPIGYLTEDSLLAPDGSTVRLLLDVRHGATACSMVEVSIPPGGVSRPVRHRTVEEAWYVVSGAGEVWRCPPDALPADIPPVSVTPGDALVIPVGWAFQFRAYPGGPLRFLCVTMPPWPGMDEAERVDEGGLGEPTLSPS